MTIDPVCGMEVDPLSAEFTAQYQGKDYYFCSALCKTRFRQNPEAFLSGPGAPHPK